MVQVIHIDSLTPFEMGFEHGSRLKKTIQELYATVMTPFLEQLELSDPSKDLFLMGKGMIERMNPSIMEELKGLAEGAEIPIETVIKMNTFLTVFPKTGACNAICADFRTSLERPVSLAVENFKASAPPSTNMTQTLSKTVNMMSTMQGVQKETDLCTIQSIILDPLEVSLYLSVGLKNAADGPFIRLTKEHLFERGDSPPLSVDKNHFALSLGKILIGRNLDWHLPQLGEHTIVLVRGKVATVTFPGYIGCLTGMTSEGESISVLQQGETCFPDIGVENSLAFYDILFHLRGEEIAKALYFHPYGGTCNILLGHPKYPRAFYYEEYGIRKKDPELCIIKKNRLKDRSLFQINCLFARLLDESIPHTETLSQFRAYLKQLSMIDPSEEACIQKRLRHAACEEIEEDPEIALPLFLRRMPVFYEGTTDPEPLKAEDLVPFYEQF
ncbi:MAG: hypothetical protein KBC64_01275 [Simkaniaceae bacterium]|nr:hypothetical protein [Simkaniaceae bacterium]